MAIKLFGGRVTIGKDLSPGDARGDDYYSFMQQRYGTDYTSRNRLNAYKNIVYDCVTLIGEQCGSYEPKFMRRRGDQLVDINDHELLRLLDKPTGKDMAVENFSKFDLFEGTASYQELQGDAFWLMGLGGMSGRPRTITLLRPDKVGTDVNSRGEILGYFIRKADGSSIPLNINEILRFPLFNPKDPYKGLGRVEAGADYILSDEYTSRYTKNFFLNNAGLSGILSVKGEITKQAFRKMTRAWREKYEGVDNAGKVMIARESDASFTKIGLGLNELDMTNLRKMSLEDVAMLFKVPLPLLGKLSEGAGFGRANIEVLEYIFAKYKIDTMFKRYDDVLQFALQRYYGETDIIVRHQNIIPDDKEFLLNARDKGVHRWLTPNEIRNTEGLDPVDGGNELFVGINQIPLNESGTTVDTSKGLTIKIIRKQAEKTDTEINAENKETFRSRLMRNQGKYEKAFRKKLDPVMEKQRHEALTNLEAHGSAMTKDAGQSLFDEPAYDALMVQELSPVLLDLTQQQGALALVFAGDTENEFRVTAPIASFVRQNIERAAKNFNDETSERLIATLTQGISDGESLQKLKNRVNTVYDDLSGYRGERLSRTETLKSSNNATVWAYRQTGYVKAKQWVVNPGSCPQCDEFEGKVIPLDDAFLGVGESYTYTDENGQEQTITNTYDTVAEPPLHPNCRCTIIPIR